MNTYTSYTAYFEQIAIDFFGHTESEKHFYRKGLEEFLNGLSTDVRYPALLLGKYDFTMEEVGADNWMKNRNIAFIICDHVADQEDYSLGDNAADITEDLFNKIFNRIVADITEPRHDFLQWAKLGNIRATPVQNYADGNHGFFVTIDILSHHNTATV